VVDAAGRRVAVSKFAVALMVIAGLVSLTGGTAFSRAATNDERAFILGTGAGLRGVRHR
jgi:hypothetical protein